LDSCRAALPPNCQRKDRGNVGQQFQKISADDAAINPGNSGGPLVNMSGQVIGINTAIITGGHGNEGVGFALRRNSDRIYNQLIANGKVTRGSIGVSFTETQGRQSDRSEGTWRALWIVLHASEAGSPRKKLVQSGDVITSVNGRLFHRAATW